MNDLALISERIAQVKTDVEIRKVQEGIYIKEKTNRYNTVKYAGEYLIAAITVVLLLPVFIIVAIAIKIDSGGSVVFKQKRTGLSGKSFTLYKFRTMIEGADRMRDQLSHLNEMDGGKLFKSDSDPRITRIGKFLRKSSIDELPQLFNILKGDMTIIGPRPLSTPIEEYDKEDLIRFRVKPGLGCIWQAYFRKETDFKTWMKTDVIYVQTQSFKLDVVLFYQIIRGVLLREGAR